MDIIHNFNEASGGEDSGNKHTKLGESALFRLLNERIEFNYQDLDQAKIPPDNFLQKLHIRNHEICMNEITHEFFREDGEIIENKSDLLSEEDEYLFKNVQKAVAEQDIIDLRTNLQYIFQNTAIHHWSSEEIDSYVDGDIEMLKRAGILYDSHTDKNLADDIKLYREIEEAIGETDIIVQLRSALKLIINSETLHSFTNDEIEDYLSNELEDSSKSSFDDELMNNRSLTAKVKFYREINESLCEKDVMELRATLESFSKVSTEPVNRQKRGILSLKLKNTIWYAAAASVILMIGLNLDFNNHSYTKAELYTEFYQPVKSNSGATRSALRTDDLTLNQAMTKMSMKDYDSALKLFSDILVQGNQNAVANYYTGAIYQQRGQFANAIQSFAKVTAQGDNLFIEQSEWYQGLCYLSMDQREKAIQQFRKLALGNGYYQQQSLTILKKLKKE